MNSTPILKGKHAVVFGAGGSIGSAVAKEFAAEGAEVFLCGRSKPSVEGLAKEIAAKGGRAHAAVVDTLDDAGVNQYIDGIVRQTGKIDIILDAAGPLAQQYGNGKLAVDLPIDQFMVPLQTMVKSRFITARAAARHMVKQHSGVIIFVTGSPARPHVPGATAIGAAFGPIENLTANLAFEVSPFGVRVVCDVIGERTISPQRLWIPRPILKWLILNAPWPRNAPTRPEVDQCAAGTPPTAFESDRLKLLAVIE
jgi:3-oxoacyl-[acyl-carrier protein] reductase